MATVCAGGGGRLIRIGNVQQAAALSLSLGYNNRDNELEPVDLVKLGVAIGVQADQRVQAQFQNALSDAIFVTPFGDAPGQIRITFVANRRCRGTQQSGFDVIQHYFDRRLQPGVNKFPAVVSIGPGSFRAFLTNLLISGNTSDIPVIQGTLVFTAWPS